MKVTTDSCLFGAIIAHHQHENTPSILDIGTGTGLLSCMIAQKYPLAAITAIDISSEALLDAESNVTSNQFHNIKVINCALQDYKTNEKYHLVICNPPFYENQLKASNALKNVAHHDSGLSLPELFANVNLLLENNGSFWILLPFYRHQESIDIAATFNLFPSKIYYAKQTPKHSFFRSIIKFKKIKESAETEEIMIKDEHNEYSKKFAAFLQPYYLYL